jgi:tetratricopeptide (TPR) repeat protein
MVNANGCKMRMPALFRYITLLIVSVSLSGCFASKSFVHFEILEPAPVNYPEQVNRIGYLNRAPVIRNEYSSINPQITDPYSIRVIDTIISNNIRKGFFEGGKMTEVSYMKDIPLLEARRVDTVGQAKVLDFSTRQRLMANRSLDALIALEYYHLRLTRSYTYYDFTVGDYMQEFRLYMEVLWRTYVKDSIAPFDEFLSIDTLYYYNRSDMSREDYLSVTSVIREGSVEMGFRYGIRQIPLWTGVSRIVFRGGEQGLILAARYTDSGKWEEAGEIWKELTQHESQKIAARALHNLAIYHELQDDLQIAEGYAKRALELWDNRYIKEYRKQIGHRLEQQEKVFKQLR